MIRTNKVLRRIIGGVIIVLIFISTYFLTGGWGSQRERELMDRFEETSKNNLDRFDRNRNEAMDIFRNR